MRIETTYSWCILLLIHYSVCSDYNHTTLNDLNGIYFDAWGYVQLYASHYKLITYVNMEPARESLRQVKKHVQSVSQFCDGIKNQTWYGYTDCLAFRSYIGNRIRYVERLKDIVADYTVEEPIPKRRKRGVLNFIGHISKILFGTLDNDDAAYYTSKISELEQDQKEFLRIAKDQMTVIKSAVSSFNSTIRDVERNERVLKDGLAKLTSHVNKVTSSLYDETQTLAMISEHVLQIERVMSECKEMFELIIDALIHAQDGAIQPQIITAMQIKNIMKDEQSITGLDYPVNFPSQELMRIITPQIYIQNKFLVYILKIPLLIPQQFQLYQIVPFPAPAHLFNKSTTKHLYIESPREFIITDNLHQRFAKMTRYQVERCYQLNEMKFVCKEAFPITSYKPGEDCEATLLHPSTTETPSSCSQRMIEIRSTLWIKLFGNEWLHVTPKPEIFTILCGESQSPKSLTLEGRGRLQMQPGCKGYSVHSVIFAYATITSNATFPDVIPNTPIDLDCCLTASQQTYLEKIKLNLPISNVLSHTDELQVTAHKIEEVNELINDEKWRLEHSQKLQYTSWITTIAVVIFALLITICCSCYCCKCCRRFGSSLWNNCQHTDCMKSTKHCFLQQTIHTGNVHYHRGSTISLPITAKEVDTSSPGTSLMASDDHGLEEVDAVAHRTRSHRTKNSRSTWR